MSLKTKQLNADLADGITTQGLLKDGLHGTFAATFTDISGDIISKAQEGKSFSINIIPTIDIRIVLLATALLIVCGVLAGFFPARNAVKIKPIEAMNYR